MSDLVKEKCLTPPRTCRICTKQFTENSERACRYHPERWEICSTSKISYFFNIYCLNAQFFWRNSTKMVTTRYEMFVIYSNFLLTHCMFLFIDRFERWKYNSQLLFMLWWRNWLAWLLLDKTSYFRWARRCVFTEAWYGCGRITIQLSNVVFININFAVYIILY